MEMGAMAVSYLAMNMAKRQGRYEEEYSFAIDPDSLWSESDRKIPIITIHQLITYMRRSEMPYAQNGFLVAQAQSYERKNHIGVIVRLNQYVLLWKGNTRILHV